MSLNSQATELADDLRDIAGHEVSARNFTLAMWAAYRDALPTLALTLALSRDEGVRRLVSELAALPVERRARRAREMAKSVPGRYGSRAVTELLLRAADGRPFAGSASFACYRDAPPAPDQAQKKPKGTHVAATHDAIRSAADCALETVQRLVGGTAVLQPPKTPEAHAQQLRSFLQEVAAYVLRRGERDGNGKRAMPSSPLSRRRRAGSRSATGTSP